MENHEQFIKKGLKVKIKPFDQIKKDLPGLSTKYFNWISKSGICGKVVTIKRAYSDYASLMGGRRGPLDMFTVEEINVDGGSFDGFIIDIIENSNNLIINYGKPRTI